MPAVLSPKLEWGGFEGPFQPKRVWDSGNYLSNRELQHFFPWIFNGQSCIFFEACGLGSVLPWTQAASPFSSLLWHQPSINVRQNLGKYPKHPGYTDHRECCPYVSCVVYWNLFVPECTQSIAAFWLLWNNIQTFQVRKPHRFPIKITNIWNSDLIQLHEKENFGFGKILPYVLHTLFLVQYSRQMQ